MYLLFFIIATAVCTNWLELLEKTGSVDLVSRPPCIQEAIKSIVPICISRGVEYLDPESRKLSAVELSICEFNNAGIVYPDTCHDLPHSLDRCIADIEKSPQHWTTFSGYYREIQTICYEEALPYEKDHILGLFANVTRAYSQFFDHINRSSEFAADSHRNIQNQFESLEKSMHLIFAQYTEQANSASQHLEAYRNEVEELLNEAMRSFTDGSEVYAKNFEEMESELDRVSSKFHDLTTTILSSNISGIVTDLQVQLHGWTGEAQSSLDRILDNMQDLEIVTVANEKRARSLGEVLEASQQLADNIEESLETSGLAIQEQGQMVRTEFNVLFQEVGTAFESYFGNILNESAKNITELAIIVFSRLDSHVNETEHRLAKLQNDLDGMAHTVSNVTDALSGAIHQWNSVLNACYSARKKIASWKFSLGSPFRGISNLVAQTFQYIAIIIAISTCYSLKSIINIRWAYKRAAQLVIVVLFFAFGAGVALLILQTISSLSRIQIQNSG